MNIILKRPILCISAIFLLQALLHPFYAFFLWPRGLTPLDFGLTLPFAVAYLSFRDGLCVSLILALTGGLAYPELFALIFIVPICYAIAYGLRNYIRRERKVHLTLTGVLLSSLTYSALCLVLGFPEPSLFLTNLVSASLLVILFGPAFFAFQHHWFKRWRIVLDAELQAQ